MSQDLLIATRNHKKKKELQAILEDWDVKLLTLDDIAAMPEIEEDGATFADNAMKKAQTIAALSGFITLADDSGLEVDALGGAPGIFSARFAGLDADDDKNNRKLMFLMQDIALEQRTAQFVCVIAIATPEGVVETAEGVCKGQIEMASRGLSGFGYDPLFTPAGFDQTFAELSDQQKNAISHRGRALQQARPILQRILGVEGTM